MLQLIHGPRFLACTCSTSSLLRSAVSLNTSPKISRQSSIDADKAAVSADACISSAAVNAPGTSLAGGRRTSPRRAFLTAVVGVNQETTQLLTGIDAQRSLVRTAAPQPVQPQPHSRMVSAAAGKAGGAGGSFLQALFGTPAAARSSSSRPGWMTPPSDRLVSMSMAAGEGSCVMLLEGDVTSPAAPPAAASSTAAAAAKPQPLSTRPDPHPLSQDRCHLGLLFDQLSDPSLALDSLSEQFDRAKQYLSNPKNEKQFSKQQNDTLEVEQYNWCIVTFVKLLDL